MRRRTVVLGCAGAAVLAVAGVAAASGGGSGDDSVVSSEVRAADPVVVEHTTIERLTCPDGRGGSALADADHDRGVDEVDGGYAEGQVAAFTLRLRADDSAPEPLDVSFDVLASAALGNSIGCAFVDPSDPDHLEQPAGAQAIATLAGAVLTVTGLEAGESVVVEMWTTIRADEERDAAVSLDLTPRPASLAASTSIAFDTEFGRFGLADDEPFIELDASTNLLALGQSVTATVDVVNPSEVDALSRAVLSGTVGTNASIDSIEVSDDTGSSSECETDGSDWRCVLGFLVPGEEITVSVAMTATGADPPESGGVVPADAICGRSLPRICHEVELAYLDTFDINTTDAEYEIRITSGDQFTVSHTQTPASGVRIGDSVEFELAVFVNDEVDSADSIEIEFSSCPAGVNFVRGDPNDNNQMEPGETWVYECTADSLPETIAIVRIRAELGDREPVDQLVAITLAAYDARMSLTSVRVVEGSSWDLENTGDVELTNVELNPFGSTECEPEYRVGDANGDSVLQPGEVWQFDCPEIDADAAARAQDLLGRAVEARVPPPDPDD